MPPEHSATTAHAADPVEVSILMPIRNEAPHIGATLDAVLAQRFDGQFEVVIADGQSTDGTREIIAARAARDPRIRIVDNPGRGTPQGLNAALRAASGRFLVRVDGHSKAPADYVQRLVEWLRSGECEAVGGRKLAVGTGHFGRAVAAAHNSRLGIGDSKYHYAAKRQLVDHVPFGAYLTDRARAIGGWNEALVRNQDYEFDYRYRAAGARILLDPAIAIEWRVREGVGALARQYFAYGYWRLRTLAEHPRSLRLRWLVPPALALALGVGAALAWTSLGRWLLVAAGGGYALFLGAGSLLLGRTAGFRLLPFLALALAVMHLSWAAGFWWSALTSPRGRGGRRRRDPTRRE